ncbi:Hypothetical predicted protein [Pelobates cultripes]|uniref:Uncharacterized protein n=1 Tax=Pelobates cultripes TaxID=61616 RepID=A0AAD1SAK3_PELCU|nr:Hypothetical predicted protein [Pelobates cultripes]
MSAELRRKSLLKPEKRYLSGTQIALDVANCVGPWTCGQRLFLKESFEQDASVVEYIVSLGKSMGLEENDEDMEKLVKNHQTELTIEKHQNLQREQQQMAFEELSSEEEAEEERENVPNALIKEMG